MEKVKKIATTVLTVLGILFVLIIVIGVLAGKDDSDKDKAKQEQTTEKSKKEKDVKEEKKTEKKKNTQVEDQEEKKKNDNVFECEYDDTKLEYDEVTITDNDLGGKVLVIYFNFTNNSNENKSFMTTYTVRAFQNGVEMNDNYFHVGQETRNASSEVQPGATVRVAESYEYTGDKSTITVEGEPWISLGEKKLIHFDLNFK
jgi:flagellar biosynthesis component FlhA